MILCGLDEVGRGALAGPIVASAIILKTSLVGLNDSKKIHKKRREELLPEILEACRMCLVTWIDVEEINEKGIGWANKEIFQRLISEIEADEFVVDGNLKLIVENKSVRSLIDADETVPEVMAASIVAKVSRDALMAKLHLNFPEYGWERNVGYGTKIHFDAIKNYGPNCHHRSLFIRSCL